MNLLIKFWKWLWKSNSLLSWVIFLFLVFVFVKFIFFPISGLLLGTSMPFVIVESKSMQHDESFDVWYSRFGSWYEKNNITKEEILKWSFPNGISKGDIVIIKGEKNYKKGDIIVFRVEGKKTPIIHRIVNITKEGEEVVYSTKGDRNEGQLPKEVRIKKSQIIGRAVAVIPYLGWIKLSFVELIR
ncbi:MAG: signal peptidase I [Candidatus Pacearchaeota archaeon]|nr:signal peptidase I [Candidatus Pacearchaeota archaeon]